MNRSADAGQTAAGTPQSDDYSSFVAGYLAALRDIDGGRVWQRNEVVWADPPESANRSFHANGQDWVSPMASAVHKEYIAECEAMPKGAPNPRTKPGTVYVFWDGGGRVKIGWTGNAVESRRRAVESASGCDLSVLATLPGTETDEAALQATFQGARLKGEWFTRTAGVDDWIASLPGGAQA